MAPITHSDSERRRGSSFDHEELRDLIQEAVTCSVAEAVRVAVIEAGKCSEANCRLSNDELQLVRDLLDMWKTTKSAIIKAVIALIVLILTGLAFVFHKTGFMDYLFKAFK